MENCKCKPLVEERPRQVINIERKPFDYYKGMGNAGCGIEPGDVALNGWLTPNEFGKFLVKKETGSPLLIEGWEIVESQKIN